MVSKFLAHFVTEKVEQAAARKATVDVNSNDGINREIHYKYNIKQVFKKKTIVKNKL